MALSYNLGYQESIYWQTRLDFPQHMTMTHKWSKSQKWERLSTSLPSLDIKHCQWHNWPKHWVLQPHWVLQLNQLLFNHLTILPTFEQFFKLQLGLDWQEVHVTVMTQYTSLPWKIHVTTLTKLAQTLASFSLVWQLWQRAVTDWVTSWQGRTIIKPKKRKTEKRKRKFCSPPSLCFWKKKREKKGKRGRKTIG